MIYDDAELYDLQYASYRDDFAFYRTLAADQGGAVLELGAGTGRLTEALAGAGHEVVAVDSSEAMLQRARSRLRGSPGAAVTFELADMREVRLERRFALVITPFNTLMHAYTLDDQDRTLRTVVEHLEEGGLFAFDLYVPRFGQMGVLRREPEWSELTAGSELFFVQHHSPAEQLITSEYYFDTPSEAGLLKRRRATLVQRYYYRYELERALRAAGLGQLRLFGGFQRERLSETSPLMVGLARRS